MNISLTERDSDRLEELLDRRDCSMDASSFYNQYLESNYADLCSLDVEGLAKENHMTIEQAFFSSLLMDLGMVGVELGDALKYDQIDKVRCLDVVSYLSNPYLKNVRPKAKTSGSYALAYNKFLPYEGFIFEDISYDREHMYSEINHLGFFKKEFTYLELLHDGKIWMSITPYEIETMKKPLERASGHVLALGLGLGYFAYMCLCRKEVIDVTVVENDKTIIELFKKEILPFFPHGDRLHIVESDAYEFISGDLGRYDYLFIDLHHDETDGLPFFLEMSRLIPRDLKHDFWIENSLLAYSRRILIGLVEEGLDGLSDSDYRNPKTFEDKLFSGFHSITKDVTIDSMDSLLDFLSDDSIRGLARKWNLKM